MGRLGLLGCAGAIGLALGILDCASDGGGGSPVGDTTSPAAAALLSQARTRFPEPVWSEAGGRTRGPSTGSVMGHGMVARFDTEGASLVPRFPASAEPVAVHRALVRLPARASAPFSVRDVESAMAVDVTLASAPDVTAEVADGCLVYRGAAPGGADVVHRATPEGTEDFVLFEHAPDKTEVEYDIALSPEVAGLRHVAGTLELLDATGTPRLHVARPYLIDSRGAWRAADLTVEGCAADTSPAPPWGRPVTPPGASRCRVRIAWGADLVYPALLDPLWSTAGTLLFGHRGQHTGTVLDNGRVLVAGGQYGSGVAYDSAELYDPPTSSWSATGTMTDGRLRHTATLLADGTVLVAGGAKDTTTQYLATSEAYDPVSGQWSPKGDMPGPRRSHVATRLASGKVLLAGGSDGVATKASALYDPAAGTWTAAANMAVARSASSGALLDDGRFLIAGGYDAVSNELASAEIYDPVAATWSPTGAMFTKRGAFPAVKLGDGKVLVSGGYDDFGMDGITAAEVYDPSAGAWTSVDAMNDRRESHSATLLQSGQVLVAGGENYDLYLASAEIFDPAAGSWTKIEDMSTWHVYASASLLGDGSVLVVAGRDWDVAERFVPLSNGTPCDLAGECLTGLCVQGVCCDQPCSGICTSCLAVDTKNADGTCAPIPAGEDPNDECTDDGSPSCQHNGFCDGAGACQKYSSASGCAATPCTTGAECTAGHCADGVCCDQPCDGECMSCLAVLKGSGSDGACGPVVRGTDPENDCGDDGSTNCSKILLCDGAGKCIASLDACAPYVCLDSHSCKSSCNVNEDCAADYRCKDAVCIAKAASCEGDVAISAEGKEIPCAPYGCDDIARACRTSCSSVSECAAPNVCDTSKHCVAPPSKATADGGCGCRTPGSAEEPGERGAAWVLFFGAAALWSSRRRVRS